MPQSPFTRQEVVNEAPSCSAEAHLAVSCLGPSRTSQQEEEERNRLVLEHLATVRVVARTVHARMPKSIELEDLVSAGYLGLVDAAAKFDGNRQVQFKSYAQIRIRGAILDSMRSLDWSPRELRRQGRAMSEAIRTLVARLGRSPVDAEIAEAMGLDLPSFQQLTGELKGLELRSLNEDRSEEIDDEEIAYVAAPAEQSPLELCIGGQSREALELALEKLSERERLVIKLYYFEELTLKEIGLTLGVVESRVSQVRAAAVAHLWRHLRQPQTSPAKKGVRVGDKKVSNWH